MARTATNMRTRLSWMWVFVMLNMIYADILSFMSAGVLKQFLAGNAGGIAITPAFLLLVAVLTEIPIAMALLTQVLPQRAARWANVIAALFTIVYVVGMGSVTPHYIFIAGLETLACGFIAWSAWTWRGADDRMPARVVVAE
jgi:hypothetical protein